MGQGCWGPWKPSESGFIAFLRSPVGIPVGALPDNSPTIHMAYCVALSRTPRILARISPINYQLALYNLGASLVFNYAQDPSPVVPAPPPAPQNVGYFAFFRNMWNLTSFVSGVVQSASDQGTSESLVVPAFMEQLTLADLQLLRDPYGRAYLSIVQSLGGVWGLNP